MPFVLTETGCPSCGHSAFSERIRRSWLMRTFLPFLPLQRYQCCHCNTTYYTSSKQTERPEPAADQQLT